jgi:cell shape-determining protein MreC
MTESENGKMNWRRRLTAPGAWLATLLAVAGGLMAAPARYADQLRGHWQALLAPAQRAADDALAFSREHVARLQAALANADELAMAEKQVKSLTSQNEQLTAQLNAARLVPLASGDSPAAAPLLMIDKLPARVLGHTAQTFLSRNALLDVGSRQGAMSGELVIDVDETNAPLVDVGRDLGAQSGRLVLSGGRIWGKLAAVGAATSSIQRATDVGYRDRVQLAHGGGAVRQLGPQGMLVGAGESVCRIELVDASQPVSVGDEVYAAGDGTLAEPLLYGRIVRAEHISGRPHWQLWMAPALAAETPRTVEVLKLEVNPARMARR